MKLKKFLKISFGLFFALPIALFVGNETLANNFFSRNNENILACGGGGGSSPAAKKAQKERQTKAKLSFKKRQLAKQAAAGEPTDELMAEIKVLEALLAE